MKTIPKWEDCELALGLSHAEFRCKCKRSICDHTKVGDAFLIAWTKLREITGPLKVNSGYRCEYHNEKVGGRPNSKHKLGNAIDISWKGELAKRYTVDEFEKILRECGFKYFYFRPEDRFWHMDCRDEE